MNSNQEKIKLIADAAQRASNYLARGDLAPVFPPQSAINALSGFANSIPFGRTDAREVLARLDELGSPATVRTTKGRYFGYVIGNSEPAATAANMLARFPLDSGRTWQDVQHVTVWNASCKPSI